MGTPHQDGSGVHLGELMLNVTSIYAPISHDFVTKFAYETLPTPIALGRMIMVSFLFSTPVSYL